MWRREQSSASFRPSWTSGIGPWGGATSTKHEEVKQYLVRCTSTNQKNIQIRNQATKVDKLQDYISPDNYKNIQDAVYFKPIPNMFNVYPLRLFYDMMCVLITLLTFYNAQRPSAILNIQWRDIEKADRRLMDHHSKQTQDR